MATMTKDQLVTLIKEQTAPLIKDTIGTDVADLVRQNVESALAPFKAARSGSPLTALFGGSDHAEAPKREKGMAFARCVRAMLAAKIRGGGIDGAIDTLRKSGDGDIADVWQAHATKALSSGDPTAGGFLVPTQFSTDVIELLRAAGVVRSLNPSTLPMPTGSVKIPKITTGATAAYVGENSNITKSQEVFGQITLTWKKIAALVPISNDLVRFSSPSADAVVRDDVVRALSTREDLAFIRGDGTSSTPKGIKNWMHSDHVVAANSSVSLANVVIDIGKLVQKLMAANVPLVVQQNLDGSGGARGGFIITPRTWRYLTTVQNGNGFYAFRDEMMRGTIWGFPFRVTTQVPETMSGTADTGGTSTEVYFGAFAHAVIGEALGVMVDASSEAAYHDGSSVVAAFSQDQTVIRVIAEHDFALRHDKSFAMLSGVGWGA